MILLLQGKHLIHNNTLCGFDIMTSKHGFYFTTSLCQDLVQENQKYVKGRGVFVYSRVKIFGDVVHASTDTQRTDSIQIIGFLNGIYTFTDGHYHFCRGYLHHDKEPAVTLSNGTKKWYSYSLLHRENDQPAIVFANGDKEYYFKNRLHRVTGPALVLASGPSFYYNHGVLHRDNGPALITHQCKEWYHYGVMFLHVSTGVPSHMSDITTMVNGTDEEHRTLKIRLYSTVFSYN